MTKVCMAAYTNYLSDTRVRREAEALAQRGDIVHFVGLKEKDRPIVETIRGVIVLRINQCRYRGSSNLSYLLAYLFFSLRASAKIFWLHWTERYDIIYLHTIPDFAVFMGLLPKIMGAKIILNIHDMMPELYMSKFNFSEKHFLIRLIKFQEYVSATFADKVICVHHPHREVLIRRGIPAAKISILLNLPDPLIFQQGWPQASISDRFRIVYHGTIAKRLGLDIAVKAFAKALPICPNSILEIHGQGDYANALKVLIDSLGLHKNVYFSDQFCAAEAIAKVIQGASLGIVANRSDYATQYMLPVKMLEYIHLGIPTMAPRLFAIQYYFNETQLAFFEPENIDSMAAIICNLYKNEDERKSLSINAKAFYTKYNWNSMKQDLFKIVDCW
jgi:glycosyltransferase involved in cell wall biosynthesis